MGGYFKPVTLIVAALFVVCCGAMVLSTYSTSQAIDYQEWQMQQWRKQQQERQRREEFIERQNEKFRQKQQFQQQQYWQQQQAQQRAQQVNRGLCLNHCTSNWSMCMGGTNIRDQMAAASCDAEKGFCNMRCGY